MPRPIRIIFPALTISALAQLIMAWLSARGDAAAHRWQDQGLGWLAEEHFALQPTGRSTLAVFAVTALVAILIEATTAKQAEGQKSFLRQLSAGFGHPIVVLLAVVAAFVGPNVLARTTRPMPPKGSPNVLFVMVDTWRADHAGFLGYERDTTPLLDDLTGSAAVFERAMSQASWTKPAVGTLFTGQVPSQHGAVSNPIQGQAVRGVSLMKSRTTFLEVLRGHGWETAGWSANPNIVPARGFAQGCGAFFDAFNDPRHSETFDPGRGEFQIESLRGWLGQHGQEERPFAVYLHIMDPHYPYAAPAPFGGTFDKGNIDFDLTGKVCDAFYEGEEDISAVTPEMRQHVIDQYDEEIKYMDHHVGKLIGDVLRDYPDTVVILVSDHGEEFLEHGQFGHGIGLWDSLVHVPLAIWAPGLEPERIGTQVRLMDVPSTLFDLVGLGSKVPSTFHGKSLMPIMLGAETQDRPAPMENGGDGRPAWQWRGISDGSHKALLRELDLERHPAPPLADWERNLTEPVRFLFDLAEDPGEEAGPLTEPDAKFDDLFAGMKNAGWYASPEDLFSGLRAQHVDLGKNIDALRNLGYADSEDAEAQAE